MCQLVYTYMLHVRLEWRNDVSLQLSWAPLPSAAARLTLPEPSGRVGVIYIIYVYWLYVAFNVCAWSGVLVQYWYWLYVAFNVFAWSGVLVQYSSVSIIKAFNIFHPSSMKTTDTSAHGCLHACMYNT